MKWHTVIALVLAAIALAVNLGDLLLLDYFGPFFVATWALGTFAGVGLVLALRRPEHPVGWLFLLAGVGFALSSFLPGYTWRALVAAPGTLPGGEFAAALRLIWMPTLATALLAVMLFPNGVPLSRRWAVLMAAMSAAFAITLVCGVFEPGRIALGHPIPEGTKQGNGPTIPNPLGVGGTVGQTLAAVAAPLLFGTTLAFMALTLVTVVVRFVRSSGVERLQLKWFAYSASLALALFVLNLLTPRGALTDVITAAGVLAFGFIPVTAGIAIVRYRLYDIDLLINRTLVYGATSAGLLATYILSVLALSTLLRPLTGSSDLAVAGSTLAVVALFGPLRQRIQRAVDRRFSRSRYDAARTLDAFSARLRDEVDLDAVRADLLGAVRATVQPAHAGVWLRERGQ